MSRPRTSTPATPGAEKLRDFLVKKFGSVDAGARAAGLSNTTMRRYLYDPPKHHFLSVVTALEKVGARREWIVPGV